MSKKISVITLHSVQNYGSALQTYATQKFFERIGRETEIVDYVRENNLRENLVATGLKNSRFWNRNFLTRFVYTALRKKRLEERYDIFDDFIKRNINITPQRYYSEEDLEKNPPQADVYCTGSDQTWNTFWNRGILKPFFLCYAPRGAKKISYAASFGKKSLDKDEEKEIYSLLKDYSGITVREKEGAEIVRSMGLCAECVLDPTLMLRGDEWRRLAAPRMFEKYVLIYQFTPNKTFNEAAKQLAKAKGLRLIRIGFANDSYLYCGKSVINPTVEEFLSLIANAEYIVTDSFHATSFAINLKVDFACYMPKKFSGRIQNILEIAGLEKRVFESADELLKIADEKIDFSGAEVRIDEMREKSENIMKKILND